MPTDRQTPAAPKTGSLARYAVSLVLLVAIIGGIAWVVQYLPGRPVVKPQQPPVRDKELVRFAIDHAIWDRTDPGSYRDFEPGEFGHYDFLFKNYLGEDVEVVHYSSTCDCTSMLACALPLAEVDRLGKIQAEKPGDPLPYENDPKWEELPKDPLKPIHLKIGANQGGVVRVRWNAKKAAGSELNVQPKVYIQADGDPSSRREYKLFVPARTSLPVRIYPPRVPVGTLTPGLVVKAEFDAWSATRPEFKFELQPAVTEPFFEIKTTPLSKQQCAGLEKNMAAGKMLARVKAGYHVTVTIHESKDGKQLDLGTFIRKFAIVLDGSPMYDLPGAEIVGRVQGDVKIGGPADDGKIRFKSFDRAIGGRQPVELLADANVELEWVNPHPHQPTWLNIRLMKDQQVIDGNKRLWHLEVTVPPNTRAARSFEEPDAVVLRIKGETPRYVRIPIEGHVSGR